MKILLNDVQVVQIDPLQEASKIMNLPKEPSEQATHAGALELYSHGLLHGWWPEDSPKNYQELDSIGESEFKDIVWYILQAAYAAENSN